MDEQPVVRCIDERPVVPCMDGQPCLRRDVVHPHAGCCRAPWQRPQRRTVLGVSLASCPSWGVLIERDWYETGNFMERLALKRLTTY
eukprot:351652-Chlamydomonas_euryale.AAC.13